MDLLNDLATASRVIKETTDGTSDFKITNSVQSDPPSPNARDRVSDRLSPEDIQALVAAFANGATKAQLIERFGISRSSVKRILRQHRRAG
ncbi:helix-turn-helix domain-containing protein [Streptomyces sviceus]|uniref:helix-turn-helix domain-containing protein n=1 Tax=Streptomyces sviceus TaxID=285530 RepID=UPI003332AB8F